MKRNKIALATVLAGLAVVVAAVTVVRLGPKPPVPSRALSKEITTQPNKPKVLLVNSYHEGYPWSEGIVDGALAALKIHRQKDGRLDCSASRVSLHLCYMDTKRNRDEEFKRQAGVKV